MSHTENPGKLRSRSSRGERAYVFLQMFEESGLRFSLQNFCDFTGYKAETAKIYISKKWRAFVSKDSSDLYSCKGFQGITQEAFIAALSQTWHPSSPQNVIENAIPPKIDATVLSVFILIATITRWKHRQRWRVRFLWWSVSL
jgi:hypothetical protein